MDQYLTGTDEGLFDLNELAAPDPLVGFTHQKLPQGIESGDWFTYRSIPLRGTLGGSRFFIRKSDFGT